MNDVEAIKGMVGGRELAAIIIGLPLTWTGQRAHACKACVVLHAISALFHYANLLWDERLTSHEGGTKFN